MVNTYQHFLQRCQWAAAFFCHQGDAASVSALTLASLTTQTLQVTRSVSWRKDEGKLLDPDAHKPTSFDLLSLLLWPLSVGKNQVLNWLHQKENIQCGGLFLFGLTELLCTLDRADNPCRGGVWKQQLLKDKYRCFWPLCSFYSWSNWTGFMPSLMRSIVTFLFMKIKPGKTRLSWICKINFLSVLTVPRLNFVSLSFSCPP